MINLNNKGQCLVMFVVVLPILLLIMILVIDVGNVIMQKQELDNVNYITIEYGLDNIGEVDHEKKLVEMVNKNIDDISLVSVDANKNQIKITIKKEIKGLLTDKFKIFELESSYIGYIKEGKKIIERV